MALGLNGLSLDLTWPPPSPDPQWRRMELGTRATEAQPTELWMSWGPEPSLPVIYVRSYMLNKHSLSQSCLLGSALAPLTKRRLVTQRFLCWWCSHCGGGRQPSQVP